MLPAFAYGIVEIAIKNTNLSKFYNSTFSYKESEDVVGFPGVELVNHQVKNTLTGKNEYFLDKVGIKYLINKFINTGLIGPEVGLLRRVVLGDNTISSEGDGKTLGLYIPLTRDIMLNTQTLLNESLKYTNAAMSHQEIQERRAEILAQVFIHEYGHHIFSQYIGAPSNDDPKNIISRMYIKDVRDRPRVEWNKKFYDDFYKIFYSGLPDLESNVRISRSKEKYTPAIQIYKNGEVFNIGNGNEKLKHPEIKTISFGWLKKNDKYLTSGYYNNYALMDYFFSMSEQLTRKLLPAIYKINGRYLDQAIDPRVSGLMEQELMTNNVEIPEGIAVGYNWTRGSFYTDGLFNKPGSHKVNNAVKYLRLINKMMGHDKKYELTISHSRSPWKLRNSSEALYDPSDVVPYANSLKLGGYLDDNNEGFTHIGIINGEGKFMALSEIRVSKFSIGYKRINNSDSWVNDNELDQTDYYWYAKKFINSSSLLGGSKLAFGKLDPKTNKFTFRKVKSAKIDPNGYGVMSNYDETMQFAIENEQENNEYDFFKKNVKWITPQNSQGIIFTKREWWQNAFN